MGKIIDVSAWQGAIDWKQASKEVDLAILRASCGLNTDERIQDNITGCNENGMPWGSYHYLMATTVARAEREAEVYWNAHAGKKPAFFVCDVEHKALIYKNGQQIPMNSNAPKVIAAFVKKLRALGAERIAYYGGQSIISGAFDIASDAKTGANWDFLWLAAYGVNDGTVSKTPTISCALHQFTSKGSVAGIDARVDLNRLTGEKTLSFFTGASDKPATAIPVGKRVKIVKPNVWCVRSGNGKAFPILGYAQIGNSFPYVARAENGWMCVLYKTGLLGWINEGCAEMEFVTE